jgi:hypothetical protein
VRRRPVGSPSFLSAGHRSMRLPTVYAAGFFAIASSPTNFFNAPPADRSLTPLCVAHFCDIRKVSTMSCDPRESRGRTVSAWHFRQTALGYGRVLARSARRTNSISLMICSANASPTGEADPFALARSGIMDWIRPRRAARSSRDNGGMRSLATTDATRNRSGELSD